MKLKECNLKLNLGSGRKIYPYFINIDKANLPETDMLWDFEQLPLPFKDNSVSEVICEHVLEHLANFSEFLEDLYRITQPNGVWRFVVPYYKYEGTYRDPTHKCFFSENTFDYFTEGNTFDYYSTVRVKILKKELRNSSKTNIMTPVKRFRSYIPFKTFFHHFFWNIYSEIYFEMIVVKGQKKTAAEWRGIKQ